MINLTGTKIVEIPYFSSQLIDNKKSVLIIGECEGGVEGVSETIHELGFTDVTTTDVRESLPHYWLRKNTNWEHIVSDFTQLVTEKRFDYIISISVFEHFGFWFSNSRGDDTDLCFWDHDLTGIKNACSLLKDIDSKLIITLPAGPYMNYEDNGKPFLRYYDYRRQSIIKNIVTDLNCKISDEVFYYTDDLNTLHNLQQITDSNWPLQVGSKYDYGNLEIYINSDCDRTSDLLKL